MKRILPVSLLALLPQIACAATEAKSESLLMPALKMLGALGVVVGLLLLIYAASRKGFGFMPSPKDGQIRVLETRALGNKKFLCLVRVRDQELLLGLSNERIDCLTELRAVEADFATTLKQAEIAPQVTEQESAP